MPISRSNKPVIAITMGDPSGIGPEVTLKALASRKVSRLADFLVIGRKSVMDKAQKDLRLRLKAPLLDLASASPIKYIDKALELLANKKADALVTAPVSKATFFLGHTEYLAEVTGAKEVAMIFVAKEMKIALVTRHMALKDVAASLSAEAIYKTIILTHECLKKFFAITNPRIGVLGLNPHAGDNGLFGKEEKAVILPAIQKARATAKGAVGPLVPDAAFHDILNKKYDAIVAMYHDQGLIPFKMLHFKDGVNLTLGLPFIRTSPDHGTAFDIAGKGIADPTSMIEAVKLACRLSRRQ